MSLQIYVVIYQTHCYPVLVKRKAVKPLETEIQALGSNLACVVIEFY